MDGQMDGQKLKDVQIDGWQKNGQMDEQIDGWMNNRMDRLMDG